MIILQDLTAKHNEVDKSANEEQARAIPKFGPSGSDWLSRREARIADIDDDAAVF
jgi:hypothetical protein